MLGLLDLLANHSRVRELGAGTHLGRIVAVGVEGGLSAQHAIDVHVAALFLEV